VRGAAGGSAAHDHDDLDHPIEHRIDQHDATNGIHQHGSTDVVDRDHGIDDHDDRVVHDHHPGDDHDHTGPGQAQRGAHPHG